MQKNSNLRSAVAAMLAAGLGFASATAHAQAYPARPVTFIVPFGPGSGNDVIARIIAQKVGDNAALSMVVENRAGASGGIGAELAAKSAPDGYTIFIASTSHVVNQLMTKAPYDLLRDFTPVSLAGTLPYLLLVSNTVPANSVVELIALAKAKPGQLNYAGYPASVPHFMGEMLKAAGATGIELVSYKSTGDAQTDLLSGRVQIWFTTMATALPMAKPGKVRALGVSGDKRAAVLPDVPTMTEAGYPSIDVVVSFYVLAPAGTPAPIVARLSAEISKALAGADVKERMAVQGIEPKSSTPEELGAVLKSDVAKWGRIIRDSGIKAQ